MKLFTAGINYYGHIKAQVRKEETYNLAAAVYPARWRKSPDYILEWIETRNSLCYYKGAY